jgi:hypothetical protein
MRHKKIKTPNQFSDNVLQQERNSKPNLCYIFNNICKLDTGRLAIAQEADQRAFQEVLS